MRDKPTTQSDSPLCPSHFWRRRREGERKRGRRSVCRITQSPFDREKRGRRYQSRSYRQPDRFPPLIGPLREIIRLKRAVTRVRTVSLSLSSPGRRLWRPPRKFDFILYNLICLDLLQQHTPKTDSQIEGEF